MIRFTVLCTLFLYTAFAVQGQTSDAVTNKAKSTQTVRGNIRDAESNAPLSGITVQMIVDSTKKIGAVSDKNGNFRLKNVPLGRQTIIVKAIGYQEQTLREILVTAGKETILDIALVEKITATEEVVVTFDRGAQKINTINEYAAVSARAFNIEDTKKYAGALGDPSRMVQNFAGVVGANDSRNDIVVRGNSPAGMLWQLEGLNIPNPNHFGSLNSTGGPVSILNNNNLGKSDFFSGAFNSQYGNAFAGVFDLRMRNGNTEKHEFIGQVGFNGFELGAEGPLSQESGASYIVNYRYSTLGVFKELGIDFGTGGAVPNYQDINLKFHFPLNESSAINVFSIAGRSDIAFLGNDIDTTQKNLYGDENENVRVDYQTGIAGISYETNISPQTFMKFTLGASGTNENFRGDSIDVKTRKEYIDGQSEFTTTKLSAIGQLRHKFDNRNSLSAGFTVDRLLFNLSSKDYPNGIETQRVNINDGSTLSQGYIQWKHRLTDDFTTIVGAHTQHYTLGDAFIIEPRASIQYSFGNGQTLSLGYGLHSQTQNIYDYFYETPSPNGILRTNSNMGFTKSHHFVLGYDWNFAENWRLKAEMYYQSLFDIPISRENPTFSLINAGNSFAPNDQPNLINEGTAKNIGAELTVERFFNDGFYVLATGSLFDSKYKGFDGIERNTAFNMGYVANMLAGKEFAIGDDVLSISLRLSTTGGRYLTPLDFEKSRLARSAVYDNSRAFSERQSAYFRTDLKIAYRQNFGSSTMEFAIEFQNITNNENIFQQSYNRRTNSIVTEDQQGFFPVPMFRYTF
jgi:hypothetical protein